MEKPADTDTADNIVDNEISNEKNPIDETDWYDDLPPASLTWAASSLRMWLTSLLVNEIRNTLQDVNRVLMTLEALERGPVARNSSDGAAAQQSAQAENILIRLKQSGLEEALREQIARLQASPFRENLEATLRQYWQTLRDSRERLKGLVERQRRSAPAAGMPTEQYSVAESAYRVGPGTESSRPTTEVAEANESARELLIDIFDEPGSGEIVVVAEHPGLLVNTIRVTLDHDILTLTATDSNGQPYRHECLLPAPVEPNTLSQQYRNGILEVRLKRV